MRPTDTQSLEAELRLSPWAVIGLIVVLGIGVGSWGELTWPQPGIPLDYEFQVEMLALVAGLLCLWKPAPGRWATIIALTLAVHLLDARSIVPGAQPFLIVPIMVGAWVIGPSAAAALAGGETLLLLLTRLQGAPRAAVAGGVGSTLALVWVTVGGTFILQWQQRRLAGWAQGYFQLGQSLQDRARSQQAEYKQALADAAHANQQLTLINRKLAEARLAAEAAERAKAAFVANVSHEFRTPLNMIIGFSEMITQAPEVYGGDLPPALMADLVTILRNSRHLSALIDDVLDLSQIEAGRMALTRERVSLADTIDAARAVVERLVTSKGLHMEIDVPPDLPLVFCDRTRTREVVLNLLSNAARFTDRGSLSVRARREGANVIVAVTDTGPGIAAEDMDRIFRPFEQLDSSTRRRYGGTGLGLAISRSFVELHGGAMWMESKPGVGTTVFFRLPIDPPQQASDTPLRWVNPDWVYRERTRPSLAPVTPPRPRLLVQERKGSLQRLLRRYLDNVEIVPVADLEEASAQLAHLPAQALLINAASVPDALQRLSSSSAALPETPTIICSVPDPPEAAGVSGIAEYLVKPVSREGLLAALDRLEIKGGTVLVVDDEPEARHLFWRMLASAGRDYRVLMAGTAEQALQMLRHDRPDVMLLDLVMPGMGGFALLAMRGRDPALRDIPVVVISARDPAGQPIVSDALAITQPGGLAVHQLVACFEALTQILKPRGV